MTAPAPRNHPAEDAHPAPKPAPVAVPEDRSTVFGRAAEKLRADVPMSAEVRSAVATWLEAVAVTWAGAEQHHDYDDGPIEFEETIDGLAQNVADAVHAPRPEPVVAPLPSEAVEQARADMMNVASRAIDGRVDAHRTPDLMRAINALVDAGYRLVTEDDEDTVRVPRSLIEALDREVEDAEAVMSDRAGRLDLSKAAHRFLDQVKSDAEDGTR